MTDTVIKVFYPTLWLPIIIQFNLREQLLSGFVLTYSKLVKNEETAPTTLL